MRIEILIDGKIVKKIEKIVPGFYRAQQNNKTLLIVDVSQEKEKNHDHRA